MVIVPWLSLNYSILVLSYIRFTVGFHPVYCFILVVKSYLFKIGAHLNCSEIRLDGRGGNESSNY